MKNIQINCKKILVNFKRLPYYANDEDRKSKKNPLTIGRYMADMLLVAKLESTDDPLEVYHLAKKMWNSKTLIISDERAKKLFEFVSKSDIPTMIKGQILEEIGIPEPLKKSLKS